MRRAMEPLSNATPGPELFRLDGRVALVTGAGGAFGRAISLGLARSGAHVFLVDRDTDSLEESARLVRAEGQSVGTALADVGREAEVEATFRALDETFDRVDILINNAGGNRAQGSPESFPLDVWREVLAVNLTAYLIFAQRAAQRMIARHHVGSVVNVSSIAGSTVLGRGNLAYGVSKAGVLQLTRELAVAWAHRGIRVNAVQPCQFVNAGWAKAREDPENKALLSRVLSGIPMRRMGEPEEIVGPVLFLASPAASMVTGVSLPVDGGNLALNAGGSLPDIE